MIKLGTNDATVVIWNHFGKIMVQTNLVNIPMPWFLPWLSGPKNQF